MVFSGDRKDNFNEGDVVEFELRAERYSTGCNDSSDSLSCVEPVYNRNVILDVITSIISGHFSFVSFDVNNIGNGTFIMTVNDLFLPTNTPIYWSTVTFTVIPEDYWAKVNPEIQLFSSEGEFLGNIGKERNSSLNKEIEVGDYLVVSNITDNISFRLEGDAFSSFDSPVEKPDFNDFFQTQTLVSINLKPQGVTK